VTLPTSLAGRYQLVLLGPSGSPAVEEYSNRLDNALNVAFSQLGVNFRKFLVTIRSGATTPDLDRRMPSVAVFFGLAPSPTLSSPDSTRLIDLLGDGTLIIPVVADITDFTRFVPPEIAHLNGISITDGGAEFERLAARVLEGLGLLRERRRLFISYRRVDASAAASQLYEALDAVGFDVFLDTHGVLRPGEPFQDVLWHRLADTDVALLLDSPNFLASRWTEEELARANTSNIQILQVLWPGQTEGAPAAFSTFYPLSEADFVDPNKTLGLDATLSSGSIAGIVDAVESLRARALGARQAFLVREFAMEARKIGLTVHATLERALVLISPKGERILVQPAIGIPDAERYEGLDELLKKETSVGRTYSGPPVLLYDQTGIRARWLRHLEWLNGNVACVRSLSLTDARTWLADLKSRGTP
jgi:hypothetical protein